MLLDTTGGRLSPSSSSPSSRLLRCATTPLSLPLKTARPTFRYVTKIVIIATLTGFAAVLPSPRISAPGNTQLDACAILEAWNLVWLARLLVRCYINAWVLRLRRRRCVLLVP